MTALSIREFLDQPLGQGRRMTDLTALCAQIARRPLDGIAEELRREIKARPVGAEDYRRLGVLLSQLHHATGGDEQLLDDLRGELQAAYEVSRSAALLPARRT